MCMSSPDVPDPGPPPAEPKTPDTQQASRKRKTNMQALNGGTILTSPNGLAPNASNTGGSTALGS